MKSISMGFTAKATLTALGIFALYLTSCVSVAPQDVQEEPGYYYGIGSAASPEAAAAAAKKDLITKALASSRERAGIGARVVVTDAIVESFKLPDFKPYAKGKADGVTSYVYRVKESDWDEYQAARADAARADIAPRLAALSPDSGRSVGVRCAEAAAILGRLYSEALADVLTAEGPGTPLLANVVERLCAGQIASLSVEMDVSRGFVGGETVFSGRFKDASGKATGALPVRATWSTRGAEDVVATYKSSSDGAFTLKFPKDPAFFDRSVTLTVSTGFADAAAGSEAVRAADGKTGSSFSYQYFVDAAAYFSAEALVPGGDFMVGSVAQDKRASRKEAPRKATVADFYIDTKPVTNALYAMYLGDTGADSFPAFWDNEDYNRADQPVVGVSYKDAVAFAAWLSEQLGVVKRLPTEAEWERAARGGAETIYPWGDQSPDEGNYANYNGNGKFSATSPVASYEDGKNAFGLYDMAGNVWQWTSTPRDPGKSGGSMIVKGGSWMDGPADLRISIRRELSPASGYVDVGMRLVREAIK